MAFSSVLVPFILKWEGGLSRAITDTASANPCPFQYNGVNGFHTNRGIQWVTWASYFGTDGISAQRFFAMDPADWNVVYKKGYWDKCSLDQIKSQRIANVVGDWAWMSGSVAPDKQVQHILNIAFSQHLAEDGSFGPASIYSINQADENSLYNDIIIDKAAWYKKLAIDMDIKHPGQGTSNIKGWLARLSSMQTFNDNNFKI